MRTPRFNSLALSALGAVASALLTSCGTTGTSVATRSLPAYEPPLAKSSYQTVRTTAYTHTEGDHLAYGARNALGGLLQSATTPSGSSPNVRRALPVSDARDSTDITLAYTTSERERKEAKKRESAKTRKAKNKAAKAKRVKKPEPPRIGSAAADWSRWPVGTTFRVLSTGQTYRVDDYGWALAGRNTIDLYMASRNDMNKWGVRHEPIQVLRWGDPEASLALLQSRQSYKHCRRMALELQGLHEQAATLR